MLGDGSVGRAFSACEGCAGLFLQDGRACMVVVVARGSACRGESHRKTVICDAFTKKSKTFVLLLCLARDNVCCSFIFTL
jgi:hypothetical protein